MNEVVLLTQADCAWCAQAKAALGRLSGEQIDGFREVDLASDDGCRLAERHRVLFAPGVIVNDRLVAYGRISERALRRRLGRLLSPTAPS
ncbi:MAG: thioredoxin family protein [Actinomycetota bacterium]|nr:thioredoxin family protein [Actinomycetota bacterium]